MKMFFRQITAAVLGFSICFTNIAVLAQEETIEETKEVVQKESSTEIIELTLQEAIELALKDNPQLAANEAAIKSAELSLEVSKELKKEYKDMEDKIPNIPEIQMKMAINVADGLERAYLKYGYYVKAAETGLELSKMEKDKIISSIAYDVTGKYYNVKLMEKLISISEVSVSLAKENESVVKKSYELGLVSALEVQNVENAVRKAENSLQSYERSSEISEENLKIALGIDGKDCKMVLTDEITDVEMPENVEEKISSAMNTRYDVTALRLTAELAEEMFAITEKYAFDSMATYHSAYSEYLNNKYTYENTKKLIELSLKNEYNAIIDAKENITVCENDVNIKNTEYESAKIKYEMGLITNIELTSAMANLDSSRVQLENARLTYLLAVLKFNYNTTIGI